MPPYKGPSQPTDQTQVSCIAGDFFTIRATGEAGILSGAKSCFLIVYILFLVNYKEWKV